MGDGTGGGGTIADGCIPQGVDQSTTMKMDLTYANGINEFNFPMDEGKVWSEASEGSGIMSMKLLWEYKSMLDIEFEDSGALPLNYQHLELRILKLMQVPTSQQMASNLSHLAEITIGQRPISQFFQVYLTMAKYGLPFGGDTNVVGLMKFNNTVDIRASAMQKTLRSCMIISN